MFDPIPDPISGKFILPWAVPVTRALNALGDKVGATARNERDRRASAKPLPFEVRWDATLNDGEGGYKIYLPTEHLLSYGGTYINTSDISGATPIPDANGDDTAWSVLDDIDTSADHVWLVVTVAESSGSIVSVDAEFAAEEGQAATGENVVNICIAEVSYEEPENEGDPAVVTIKQSVVGALHLGGHHGGHHGELPGPFEPVYGEDGVDGFGKGYVQVGGFTVVSTPTGDYHENPATSGQEIVAVKISVSTSASASGSSGISVELVAYDDEEDLTRAQENLDYVVYPIYVLAWDEDDHSSITMDLRRMPTTGALETFLTNSSASGGSGS